MQVPLRCSQIVQNISHHIKSFQMKVRVLESDTTELNTILAEFQTLQSE